jgi:hypothetical protein
MLNENIRRIVMQVITEGKEKRPLAGAALGSSQQAATTKKVRANQDAELAAKYPTSKEEAREMIRDILHHAHQNLQSVMDDERTHHSVKQELTDTRTISHLKRALSHVEK